MSETTPPMPASQAEWEAHWAFYRLTVLQRDQAWSEVKELRQLLERLGPMMHFTEVLEEVAKRAPTVKDVYKHESGEWKPLYERSEP